MKDAYDRINEIVENLDPESKIGEISCRTQTCKKSSLIGLYIEIYEKQFNRMVQKHLSKYTDSKKNLGKSKIVLEPTSDENIYDIHLTIEYGVGVAEQTSSINISKDSIVKVMESFCATACHALTKGKV